MSIVKRTVLEVKGTFCCCWSHIEELSSQPYWGDWYLNCKRFSKLRIYVKCKARITIKGHIAKVFWRCENETNIYWVSAICQAMCQTCSHFFSSFKAASNSVNFSPHFAIEEIKFWRLTKFQKYPAARKWRSHISLALKSIILVQGRQKLSGYMTFECLIQFALLKICFEHFELNSCNHKMTCTLHHTHCLTGFYYAEPRWVAFRKICNSFLWSETVYTRMAKL